MDSSAMDNPELKEAPKGFNQGRKVRVVAKIKSSTVQDLNCGSASSWISVNKPNGECSEPVTISFGDHPASPKEIYEVDYCYEHNEDTENIFAREVKTLIPGVFDGHHATVIAYGARGTGKTSIIQGTIEKPGLASLSINELLLLAEEKGISISISYYEVYLDHVYDLLDPSRPTVLVLDNGQGKIQLKGLSQIPVKSLSDFYGLYFVDSSTHKQGNKIASEPPHRSHKGLIVHVSSTIESTLDTCFVAKMNFVDIAGYEDARRKSTDGRSLVENSKINKSIYALLNVAYALNSNDKHVPYRESKLTRILQDSLARKESRILMVTCLNSSFCQDSIYMANLAARTRFGQVKKQVAADATRKLKSSTNFVVQSSLRNQIPKSVSATVKNNTVHHSFSEKKASDRTTSSAINRRKLFDDATSHLRKLDKEIQLRNASFRRVPLKHGEPTVVDQAMEKASDSMFELTFKELLSVVETSSAVETTLAPKELLSVVETSNAVETTLAPEDIFSGNHELERIIDGVSTTGDGQDINKGNNCLMNNIDDLPVESTPVVQSTYLDKENSRNMMNEDKSPPISARLRELSNNLRLICSSTPAFLKVPDGNAPCVLVSTNITEPQTPTMERSSRDYGEHDVSNPATPWETFSQRSTGVKKSLVNDYLKFLNTASKEELKKLRGIGEKRATSILELRTESPEPFKSLDDLMDIGLSAKQVKSLMKKEVGELLFN